MSRKTPKIRKTPPSNKYKGEDDDMYVTVSGKAHKIDRHQIRKAIQFFATELMSFQLVKNITVQIKFVKGMVEKYGDTGWCDHEDNTPYLPRDFTLTIDNNITKRTTLSTLAHEMAHVKQYATGELKDDYVRMFNTVRWRGKYFKTDEKYYMKTSDDDRYPYERDAIKWEKKLYRKWREIQNDLL